MKWMLFFITIIGLVPVMALDYLEVGYVKTDITPEISSWVDTDGNGEYTFGDGSAYGTGEKVTAFLDGKIYIGNGNGEALYVQDRLYSRVMVICDPSSGKKVALVSMDLYMLQKPECDFIRKLLTDMDFTHVAIHCTHNHMGPDTLGRNGPDLTNGINGKWLRKLQYHTADAIRRAYAKRKPANFRFLNTKTRFGLLDTRDPRIYDDDLTAMQAVDATSGKTIVTLVQWANHVEATMSIHNGNDAPSEIKEKEGHIITPGFPAHVDRRAAKLYGGGGMYFNGPVGGLLTMLHTFVWEPFAPYSPDTPVEQIPQDYPGKIHDNFKMAELIGNELIDKLHREGLQEQPFENDLFVDARAKEFKLPLHNQLFILGYLAGIIGFDERKIEGNLLEKPFITTETARIDIGPAQIICIPGELFPELSIGLPEDFCAKTSKYYHNPEWHKTGKDYIIPTPIKKRMRGKYKFIFGLTNDSLGYMVTPSDFKLDDYMPWIDKAKGHYEETQSSGPEIVPRLFKALDFVLRKE